ncbi:esterase-like activity of phytase family protein [Nitrosomonas sp.]|uniref:esterase-like activity of phytase family protein n=1 Tax=Nitrosomonas sp. TaxID=42353 RepID=UPI001D59D19A|nr:esterase-like activity of phytase family protein [Nitrosomonas sp.]MBX3617825.1 esterase-like activity of phytase family protein [Nitrosomonas sp.]
MSFLHQNPKIASFLLITLMLTASATNAAPVLLGIGSLPNGSDLSGLSGTLENGLAANILGGLGSGIAYAGNNTFLALPDRGPNALDYIGGGSVDNTVSFIARFHTIGLSYSPGTTLPLTVTTTLSGTTLLSSATPLAYAAGAAPAVNTATSYYFTGRSDNFAIGNSLNPDNARFDPEGIRVSNDGKSVFVSDEYGPYIYQFDRFTGERVRSFALPDNLAVNSLNSSGSLEISGNTIGRVANKGMEGLAISPDGSTLFGFMQSPLLQDGGDGGRMNRIVTVDIATGATHEFAYDNRIGSKNYNSSEILALNNHEFLVLERDGKGLGDGSNAAIKQLWKVDLAGATDVAALSGEADLLANQGHADKSLFLDIRALLNANGITDAEIPAKLEGAAFGDDVTVGVDTYHTLILTNDNDFAAIAGDNKFLVIGFKDTDLGGSTYLPQVVSAVPEPQTYAILLVGLGLIGFSASRRK